ncbi:MAG: threonine dehydratase [Actinomycetota bacterium]|nr:MAG: threonine dehydratase [Actinomycetota bacterium]
MAPGPSACFDTSVDLMAPGTDPLDVTRFDIEEAAERLAPWIRRTPVLELEPGAFGLSGRIALKLELHQHTGSFKARGAFNRILTAEIDDSGVIAASGGNFGLGVAYAARALGHRAEIFVPASSPSAKIDRIRDLGAQVHVVPGYYAEAFAACEERAFETGAAFLHPYDQPTVVAGQGTIARELDEQVPDLDTVLVPVGGAGLIGGIAAWCSGAVRVVGVEPERSPTLSAALEVGQPVDVDVSGVAADSLGARRVGLIGFQIARAWVDRVCLVDDAAIVRARRALWDAARIAAEPGAAAPLAALLAHAFEPEPDERVVLVVSGGNADVADLQAPPGPTGP